MASNFYVVKIEIRQVLSIVIRGVWTIMRIIKKYIPA